MQSEYLIVKQVYAAKKSMQAADDFIQAYIPFIQAEASKSMPGICTEQDDEFSIAMIAFHEAIRGYEKSRGAFLKYASLTIRSRLIDYMRKEARHRGNISLDEEGDEDGGTLMETLADEHNAVEEAVNLEATRQEIEALSAMLGRFGLTFGDVTENSPKQKRTLEACKDAIRYAAENRQILTDLLETQKLPMAQLVYGSGADRKTLERHRKYILAMLLIQTAGYETIRGHLKHILKAKGGKVV